MRLHHSFLGLASMLIPFTAFKIFGCMSFIDSGLNVLFFQTSPYGQFDFMNIVVDHMIPFIATGSALMGVEWIRKRILPYNKTETSVEKVDDTQWQAAQRSLKEEEVAKELRVREQHLLEQRKEAV